MKLKKIKVGDKVAFITKKGYESYMTLGVVTDIKTKTVTMGSSVKITEVSIKKNGTNRTVRRDIAQVVPVCVIEDE